MRDPKRIDIILDRLSKIWKANPDMRLMQLLLNNLETHKNHYNTEDDKILKALENYKL